MGAFLGASEGKGRWASVLDERFGDELCWELEGEVGFILSEFRKETMDVERKLIWGGGELITIRGVTHFKLIVTLYT